MRKVVTFLGATLMILVWTAASASPQALGNVGMKASVAHNASIASLPAASVNINASPTQTNAVVQGTSNGTDKFTNTAQRAGPAGNSDASGQSGMVSAVGTNKYAASLISVTPPLTKTNVNSTFGSNTIIGAENTPAPTVSGFPLQQVAATNMINFVRDATALVEVDVGTTVAPKNAVQASPTAGGAGAGIF